MSLKWSFLLKPRFSQYPEKVICLVVMFLESFNLEQTSPCVSSSPAEFPAPRDVVGDVSVVL